MKVRQTIFRQVHRARRRRLRRSYFRRLLLMTLILWSKLTVGQTVDRPPVKVQTSTRPAATSSLKLDENDSPKQRPTKFEGFARFESLQYPTLLPGQENLSQNNMMETGLQGEGVLRSFPSLSTKLDVSAGRSLNINYSFISVYELSGSWRTKVGRNDDGFSVTVGRHLQAWNDADSTWNLGLWSPTFSMDALRIQQQGLLGLHSKLAGKYVQASAYFSPIFIPTLTPEVADRNGAITSESRWFRSIPTEFDFLGKSTKLYYRLEIPDIQQLVTQPGGGLQLRVGQIDDGPWVRAAYANKAMNSLFFKYDGTFRTSRERGGRGEIELQPIVHRHQVASADLGYKYASGEVVLSYVQDEPDLSPIGNGLNRESLPTDFIQQSPAGVKATSFRWDQKFSWPLIRKPVQGRLAYLKAEVDPTMDLDSSGTEQSSLLPHRFNYTNAVSAEAKTFLTSAWALGFKYLRDFDQRGSLWNAEVEYRSNSNWIAVFGGDTLGVDDASPANRDNRFLNYYRQNDRVYGGLTYVF